MDGVRTFKVLLVGEGGVGKSTLLDSWKSGRERGWKKVKEGKYLPTIGVEVVPLLFSLSDGRKVCLKVWDCAGQEKFGGLRDGYYIQADAAILAFDVGSRSSYAQIPTWYRDVVRVCESIPQVLVGLKVDQPERVVKAKMITFHRKKNLRYYDVSAYSGYNTTKPITALIRLLTGSEDVKVTTQILPGGKEIPFDQGLILLSAEKSSLPLPEEDVEENVTGDPKPEPALSERETQAARVLDLLVSK
mmetsp:Transcript_30624/g.85776  ORF Transcript_30624/g.85776 Transcript_30624/m.85776 type:complete len:246 (-) Transcript_30624:12-749(-)